MVWLCIILVKQKKGLMRPTRPFLLRSPYLFWTSTAFFAHLPSYRTLFNITISNNIIAYFQGIGNFLNLCYNVFCPLQFPIRSLKCVW